MLKSIGTLRLRTDMLVKPAHRILGETLASAPPTNRRDCVAVSPAHFGRAGSDDDCLQHVRGRHALVVPRLQECLYRRAPSRAQMSDLDFDGILGGPRNRDVRPVGHPRPWRKSDCREPVTTLLRSHPHARAALSRWTQDRRSFHAGLGGMSIRAHGVARGRGPLSTDLTIPIGMVSVMF